MFSDLRFAVRRLARNLGFSVTVILLLGLALGANACVFSVIYGLSYKPLPFAQAERLVTIDTRFTSMNLDFNLGLSVPYLERIAQNAQTLSNVVAYRDNPIDMQIDGAEGNATMRVARVQPALFGVLGIGVAAGRLLNDDDARESALPTAMISWDVWQNRYARAASVIDQTLRLDGKDYRIVGVLPRGFRFLKSAPQVWTPLIFSVASRSVQQAGNFTDLYAIARLKAGSTTADASGEIGSIAQDTDGLKDIVAVTRFRATVKPLRSIWLEHRQSALDLMLLAVALVLLVTAANVCNLYIARLLTRRHEAALLQALGASSGRLLRQIVGETLFLGFAATLLGLALLPAGLALLAQFELVPQDTPQHIGIDAATLVFIAALALAVAVLMVLAAMALRRRDVHEAIKQGGARQTSGRRAQRTRQALIVGQIALTATLLVGTGLLLRSSRLLLSEDVGFDRDHLLVTAINFKIDARADEAAQERGHASLRAIVERARALPGVSTVAVGSMAPFGISDSANNFLPPGAAEVEQSLQPTARAVFVSRDYFAALGLPLTQGRSFSAEETGSAAPVAIVDADFVQRYGAGRDPLGQSFKLGLQDKDQMRQVTIVGVAAMVKQRSLDEHAERPTIYLPLETPPDPMLLVRSKIDPAAIAEPLKQIIHDIAPQAKIIETVSMREWIAKTVRDRQRLNMLLVLLGAMALTLASVGLYAVLAYTVRARTLEFGVRMALGADSGSILSGVLRQGIGLVALGLVLGLPLAYSLANLLRSRLYHVGAFDPLTLLTVATLLGAIGLAACWWPARSAARVNPIEALRHE
jgi:putative ABC transport system permease protein